MKIVVFTLTKGGKALGIKIKEYIPTTKLYTSSHFLETSLKDLVKKEFNSSDVLIFIMSTGIVVRTIAPLLQHKCQDPAVIVIDEAGKNVISLLSGHIGGANEWTLRIAQYLKANPVITTASDVKGVLSVDLFAQQNNCLLTDWEKAKKITAHLVNGGHIGIYSPIAVDKLPDHYKKVSSIEALDQYSYGILISNHIKAYESVPYHSKILQIYPKNLVVGIGCRKGTAFKAILEAVNRVFEEQNYSTYSITKFATVDVKEDEEGLQLLTKFFKVPLEIIPRKAILEVEKEFETSEFVRKTIGVGAVSGPCSFLASGGGKIILEKYRNKGITISIAEIAEV